MDEPQKHAKQKKPSHEWPYIDQMHVCKMALAGKSLNIVNQQFPRVYYAWGFIHMVSIGVSLKMSLKNELVLITTEF